MPRHASIATMIEKNRLVGEHAFVELLEIDVTDRNNGAVIETMRFARNSEDVTYQGHLYRKGAFSARVDQSANEVPDVSITVQDHTREVTRRIEDHEGGVGYEVRVMVVNSGAFDQPPEFKETFFVRSTSVRSHAVSFTLGDRNPLLSRFPGRLQHRSRCSWRYKGAECGYQGSKPSCDYSLYGPNGCEAHDNVERFGGFPGIQPRNV